MSHQGQLLFLTKGAQPAEEANRTGARIRVKKQSLRQAQASGLSQARRCPCLECPLGKEPRMRLFAQVSLSCSDGRKQVPSNGMVSMFSHSGVSDSL